MARYFFDTSDGASRLRDEVGEEMDGFESACRAALATLPEMMRDAVLSGGVPGAASIRGEAAGDERRTFHACVRDENGTILYTATLTLVGTWCRPSRRGGPERPRASVPRGAGPFS